MVVSLAFSSVLILYLPLTTTVAVDLGSGLYCVGTSFLDFTKYTVIRTLTHTVISLMRNSLETGAGSVVFYFSLLGGLAVQVFFSLHNKATAYPNHK